MTHPKFCVHKVLWDSFFHLSALSPIHLFHKNSLMNDAETHFWPILCRLWVCNGHLGQSGKKEEAMCTYNIILGVNRPSEFNFEYRIRIPRGLHKTKPDGSCVEFVQEY